jgi:hypothetical protein
MTRENKKYFNRGFAAACAIALINHRDETVVRHMFECNYMSIPTMRRSGVDEFDINTLRPIIKEINRRNKLKS